MRYGLIALLCVSSWGWAQDSKRKIVVTLPALKVLVREVAGDTFEIVTLSKADQDPHFVSPTPLLMQKVRQSELLFEIGLSLDLWVDEVANGSGNSKIYRGTRGRITASRQVPKLEIPTSGVTRAEGDLHPEGNPHLWLDPIRAKLLASTMAAALKENGAEDIERRLRLFENRVDEAVFGGELVNVVGGKKLSRLVLDGSLSDWLEQNTVGGEKLSAKLGGWLKKAEPLRGIKVVQYHKTWVYTTTLLGMTLVDTLEEKPGIAPGPKHLQELTRKMTIQKVRLILSDNFYDQSLPRSVAEATGTKVVILPNQPGGDGTAEDYFLFFDAILDRLLAAVK